MIQYMCFEIFKEIVICSAELKRGYENRTI